MRSALGGAIERAAKREFGLMLGGSHLLKLKPSLKLKSAVAACSFLSRDPERAR